VFHLAVDVFFNLLMATLPVGVAIWFLARGKRRRLLLALLCVTHVALMLWINTVRADWRLPVRDYVREVGAAKADAIWPPIRHHPQGRLSEFSFTPPRQEGVLVPGATAPDRPRPYYVLGSDNLGNDVLTRILYGTRVSLTIGIIAVAIDIVIGIALGAMAGYFGGWIDDLLMFFTQVVIVIPLLFLILFIMSVVKNPTIYHVMLVIAAVGWPSVMRLVRGEFLRQREIDYVTAARALGVGSRRIMFRHIVPNTLAPVFVYATFGVAGAILLESTIAFLGLGDPAAPSWGQLLKIGSESKNKGSHLIWAGGLAIFFMVLVINVIGEALRDALDPKMRR
jgi:ABC-type dipeptide/oligopeptide/nickel transport system permease subunit